MSRLTRRAFLGLVSLAVAAAALLAAPAARAGSVPDPDRFVTSYDLDDNVVHLVSTLVGYDEGSYRRTVTVRLRDGKLATLTDVKHYAHGVPVLGTFTFDQDVLYVEQVSFIKETFDP